MKDLIGPIVRAILQVVSGYLISKGLISHSEAGPLNEAVAGAIIAIGSLAWSAVEKQKLKDAQPSAPTPVQVAPAPAPVVVPATELSTTPTPVSATITTTIVNPVLLLCLLLLPALAIGPIGCAIKKSPERVAITATGSAVKTADAAIAAWADYVVLRKEQIKALKATDVGASMDAANELLRYEGRVSNAYYEYQAAAKAAIAIGATSSSPTAVSEKLAAASANLITLIASLTASR